MHDTPALRRPEARTFDQVRRSGESRPRQVAGRMQASNQPQPSLPPLPQGLRPGRTGPSLTPFPSIRLPDVSRLAAPGLPCRTFRGSTASYRKPRASPDLAFKMRCFSSNLCQEGRQVIQGRDRLAPRSELELGIGRARFIALANTPRHRPVAACTSRWQKLAGLVPSAIRCEASNPLASASVVQFSTC